MNFESLQTTRVCEDGHDLPHLGALLREIRTVRKISATEAQRWCGAPQTAAITKDFEQNNSIKFEYFERYLARLQSSKSVDSPLSLKQAQILRDLYENKNTLGQRHGELASINFETISPHNPSRPKKLAELVEKLQKESRPALIMDDLWFVHAFNDAQRRLYRVDPQSPFLYRWEGWHTIAAKILADSPVRQASYHGDANEFLQPTIVYLFQNEYSFQYLFTLQMRTLFCKFIELSKANKYELHDWWKKIISFYLPYKGMLSRTLRVPDTVKVHDTIVLAKPSIESRIEVDVSGDGHKVGYTLAAWDIVLSSEPSFLKNISTQQEIHYAFKYDLAKKFHVNTWPNVADNLKQWKDDGIF
jgi:hypothetical protein